jgi:hypothetical protein
MKDLYNNIEVVSLLDPIAVATTQTITDIDLAGFNSCVLLIHCGLDASMSASHKIVFVLSDSDDGVTYAAVEDADMLGVEDITDGTILSIDNVNTEDNSLSKFGYVGGKRYLQLVGTVTGTTDPPISIIVIKGHPLDVPPIS